MSNQRDSLIGPIIQMDIPQFQISNHNLTKSKLSQLEQGDHFDTS
jgi:hypothetical protein